ncbi:sodium:calcium antiporter [Aureliella helgolandensis]|uniref:Inner membrane protein YrbG n=1 Tax=Aureliella helgolandensis TaxID=2527968 RepID=A0A518GHB1_9BACT|nr:sodium:calcium antiporter [Aureliella helgolandensis]QDV27982.1 Inner membrane protein YrbG [Aureliella helgolandensis]
MFLLSLTFVALSVVIVVAAMFLAKFGDEISERTGLGGSITGLVLLAGATSLPELSVGYSAVKLGAADLTAGGILGSSLANLMILALIDLVSRRPGSILTRAAAAHGLSATVGVLLAGIILIGMLVDSPWTLLNVGPASWAVIGAYCLCARLLFLDERESAKLLAEESTAEPGESKKNVRGAMVSIGGFAVAAAVIFFVAPRMATTADTLAEVTGLGRTFVGTLLLAVVTSLPEAVSSIAAVRLGAADMAIANIFGSNAFNMLILASLDASTTDSLLQVVSGTHAITAAAAIVVTAVGLLTLLYRPRKRYWLIEPDAALIALLVLGALYLVYMAG